MIRRVEDVCPGGGQKEMNIEGEAVIQEVFKKG